jgi:hypothetical protein
MKRRRTKRGSAHIFAALAIAAFTLLSAGQAIAVTTDPNGTCTPTSCDVVLDNVLSPPGVTGGSQTAYCDADPTKRAEWHFVLTQLNNQNNVTPPLTIQIMFVTVGGEVLILDANKTQDDPEAGYTATDNLTATLIGAFATLTAGPDGVDPAHSWTGNFNLSHAPCGGTPPQPTLAIVTQVESTSGKIIVTKDDPQVINFGNISLPDTLHDRAFITVGAGDPAPDGASTVTFELYRNEQCDDNIKCDASGCNTCAALNLAAGCGVSQTSTAHLNVPAECTTSSNVTQCTSADHLFGFTAGGEWAFQARYNGDANYPARTGSCEHWPIPTVRTDIHLADHTVVTSVTMGATIHDKVTINTNDVASIPSGSSVVFRRYKTADCTGVAASEQTVALTGGASTESAESANYLVKAADIPALSYQATFVNASGSTILAECEPLTVASSITSFSYGVGNAGPFTCTLETSTDTNGNSVPDLCAVGRRAADVTVSTKGAVTSNFLVTVQVANNTGVNIFEKVQGGLAGNAKCYADSTGVCYTGGKINPIKSFDISAGCGAAVIDLSSAKVGGLNNGNVVIWGDGTTSTNQKGFPMTNGQTCTLKVMVIKGYSSIELQAVTSSWSELQTLTDGPNANFSEKSPYTGSLAACVHNTNGSVTASRNTCNQ